ncbi:hypothetical protein [Kibdelosporangium philippinense]|uniref:hypothetical protein n=1 Tax=Kibdelosporangium philippinense TaxID=211113 RepID=UPI001F22FBD5|nr:hypothetical protein [Kibdelosporangium philippinense]
MTVKELDDSITELAYPAMRELRPRTSPVQPSSSNASASNAPGATASWKRSMRPETSLP